MTDTSSRSLAGTALLDGRDLARTFSTGGIDVAALRGVDLAVRPRRVRGRDGPLRLRQVDAAPSPGRVWSGPPPDR